jgi:hypothetical protein
MMTVAAQIITDIANLQAQVAAARPLTGASAATVRAIQLNAIQALKDILANLTLSAGDLDLQQMPIDPTLIVAEVLKLRGNAQDQSFLSSAFGYVNRSLTGLNQIPGAS